MKKNLLLLHGALGSKNQFHELKSFLEGDFQIHDFNFSGHGGDPKTVDFSISNFSNQLIEYIESSQLDNIYIFGYSMGGYVAIYAAKTISEKISKIATLGTKFNWSQESTAREVKMLNPEAIEAKVPHYAEKLKATHSPQDWKTIMLDTAGLMTKLAEGEQLIELDFKSIETEIILGLGSLDKMVSPEETNQVSEWLPNSQVVLLEDVKHPIETIAPENIAHYLKRIFLK